MQLGQRIFFKIEVLIYISHVFIKPPEGSHNP